MKRPLAFSLLTISVVTGQAVAQLATPSDQQLLTEQQLLLPDPATRSGWIRVELAVLTDDSLATLGAETWPATPEVRYPGQWRWLVDLREQKALAEQFLGADIEVSEIGAVTVTLPPPPIPQDPDPQLPDSDGNVTEEGPDVAPSIDAMTGQIAPPPATAAVPLESMGARPRPNEASENPEDWLEPFAADTSLAAAAEQVNSARDEAGAGEEALAETAAAPAPPPEPVAFARRDTEMLADGLRALARSEDRSTALEAAWVQPPGARNLPIVLDDSGDSSLWPALQGFIELRRGSDLRVGVNFWLNTDGGYLPMGFAMDPPPKAEQRIHVVESVAEPLVDTELGPDLDLAVSGELRPANAAITEMENARSRDLVTYVDPVTGLERTGPSGAVLGADMPDGDRWPFRHLVAVADTRSVPEEGVRYFDHPAIQILVTWRELTWREVWDLGESDAEALAAIAAVNADEEPEPASSVPPSQRGLQ